MIDLCIDTSVGASVALVTENGVYTGVEPNSRAHAERLSALIAYTLQKASRGSDDVIDPADHGSSGETNQAGRGLDIALDQVIVGTGPAPLTGLRAGLVTAQVVGRVHGVPVRGVGSLEILARGFLDSMAADQDIVVVTDARRKEVYWAHMRARGPHDVEIIEGPSVNDAAFVANKFHDQDVHFAGPGCALYADVLPSARVDEQLDVAIASRIVRARLQAGVEEFPTQPQYLRRPDIHPGKLKK